MLRLQRELTKEFFMHDNQRVLITFSAGVAERLRKQRRSDSFIARADAAMYQRQGARAQPGRTRLIHLAPLGSCRQYLPGPPSGVNLPRVANTEYQYID
jgi:hypothetical protein